MRETSLTFIRWGPPCKVLLGERARSEGPRHLVAASNKLLEEPPLLESPVCSLNSEGCEKS